MARNFVSASSQYLNRADNLGASYPMSFGGLFRSTNTTVAQYAFSFGAASNNSVSLLFGGATPGDPILLLQSNAVRITGSGYSSGVWYHIGANLTSSTSRELFINGVSQGTNATSLAFSPAAEARIGADYRFSAGGFLEGEAAECAVWLGGTLAAADWLQLATGACPLLIRPDLLGSYFPLQGRCDPEIDVVGGLDLTLNNTPVYADHPRVYRPRGRVSVFVPAAGGGGGNRRRRVILCGGR